MLRVATTRLASRSNLIRYPQQKHALFPTRSYIFLPASFQELHQMIQEAWSSQQEKRRRIWVKLWQRPQEASSSSTSTSNTSSTSSSTRNRRLRRSIATRTRNFKARHSKTLLASKRRLLYAKQSLGKRAQAQMTSFRGRAHLWKLQLLEEPAQPDWFDDEGYPKAVQNAFGRFVNPWNSQSTNGIQSLSNFLQWRLQRLYNLQFCQTTTTTTRQLEPCIPKHKLAFMSTPPPLYQIRCTWLGHSTTLIELEGFTVLTDPIFSTKTDPWPFGEVRYTRAPCFIEDLPSTIDVCVISHDHYDHLDQQSVEALKNRVQYWAVPLGMSTWLQENCDIPQECILEMTWWQSMSLQRQRKQDNGDEMLILPVNAENENNKENDLLTLTCAPAQHWCGRNMVDRNKRLWCSWVIKSKRLSFFFAGDTALPESFPLHRQIGDRLGPFDVSALPIGAYNPSYFMKVSHASPKEAVEIHKDVQSRKSMAIHWGTFHLSEEDHDEPPRLLAQAAKEEGIDFCAIPQGDCIIGPEYVMEDETLNIANKKESSNDKTDSEESTEEIEYG